MVADSETKTITKSIHSHLHIIQILVCERALSQHKHSVAVHCVACIGVRMKDLSFMHSTNLEFPQIVPTQGTSSQADSTQCSSVSTYM
jgi:hypothetical protein